MKNQCMGCQAGWPRKWYGLKVRDKDRGFHGHAVEGGYPGEIVGCTADRYGVDKGATLNNIDGPDVD